VIDPLRAACAACTCVDVTISLLIRSEENEMDVRLEIPDDLGQRLAASGEDLSRRALEAFALEEYKTRRISKAELRRLLGIDTRYELDGFLKAHGVWMDYTIDDLRRDVATLQRLGF